MDEKYNVYACDDIQISQSCTLVANKLSPIMFWLCLVRFRLAALNGRLTVVYNSYKIVN